jgi:predicted nucleotidyltransferase
MAGSFRGDAANASSKSRHTRQIVAILNRMKAPDLIEVLKTYDGALRENGATALFIFGSRARGTARPDSDLDLFIDYNPTAKIPNMFRLMQIEEKISEDLGISVTITTRDALHPSMKGSIEREAVRVT